MMETRMIIFDEVERATGHVLPDRFRNSIHNLRYFMGFTSPQEDCFGGGILIHGVYSIHYDGRSIIQLKVRPF